MERPGPNGTDPGSNPGRGTPDTNRRIAPRGANFYRKPSGKVRSMDSPKRSCTGCSQLLPSAVFGPNRSKRSGLDGMCRACRKSYNAAYYQRTKDRHNPGRAETRRKNRANVQTKVVDFLRSHPCIDCGETDVVVLEFDHQRNKMLDVGFMIGKGYSWKGVLEEISKCEVVCANDHRRRTARTHGSYKATLGAASSMARAADF